jgi:hypothetical protein
MLNYIKIKKAMFLSLFLVWNVHASEYVPDVYQDDYIIVRSGITEAGRVPVHFGDRLSLVIEAEFHGNEVITENLDEQLFERSWGSEKGISLIGAPEQSRIDTNGQTVVRGTYYFQVLDCPGELISCRGNKTYELPIFTLGYQIIDTNGNVLNNKSVRFNPVPGKIVVMQSLDIRGEGGLDKLSNYLGNSGYPAARELSEAEGGSIWPLMTGSLIFLASFFPLLLTSNVTQRTIDNRKARHRWEKVLIHIQEKDNELNDEEWSDLLRRCITWYCMDELDMNPYSWLTDLHRSDESVNVTNVREYFIEVLNQEGIEKQQRSTFVARFKALLKAAGYNG